MLRLAWDREVHRAAEAGQGANGMPALPASVGPDFVRSLAKDLEHGKSVPEVARELGVRPAEIRELVRGQQLLTVVDEEPGLRCVIRGDAAKFLRGNDAAGQAFTNPVIAHSRTIETPMLTLGVRRSRESEEDLFFEILDGKADEHAWSGEDGRKRVLANLAERLKRKLGQEAFDRLNATLDRLPPDYFLALRALEGAPDELTFATDTKTVSNEAFETAEEAIEAAEIRYFSRMP